MKQFTSETLNIPRLLALNELDVRGVAAANKKLTARKYFLWVEWFIEDAPQHLETLDAASDINELRMIKDVLSKIGYDKLKPDMDALIGEVMSGQTEQAKKRGEGIADAFNALCGRLKGAYAGKKRTYSQIKAERFMAEAPRYIVALTRAANADELEEIKLALSMLGYDKLNADIETLGGKMKAGEPRTQIEELRGKIVLKLNEYHKRFKNAYMKISGEYTQTAAIAVKQEAESEAQQTPEGEAHQEDENEPQQTAEPEAWQETQADADEALLEEALEYFDFEESHRKLRILAVDDVAVVLNAVTSILSPHYEVFALTKASQVEKFLAHTTPELFLLDIEMPELNGYDLVSVIRGFEEHKDTPIIFLTGSATLENIKTAVSLGASDFITKPINRETLLTKIESKIVWKKAF